MLKTLAQQLLKKAGYQLIKVPGQPLPADCADYASDQAAKDAFIEQITGRPLDAGLHLQYALTAARQGKPFLAYAELKTAAFLGAHRDTIEKQAPLFRQALPDLIYMDHNKYYRLKTLAAEITFRSNKPGLSILDIGGGQGQLAAFLSDDSPYCLAEPDVNGISGTDLPFTERAFDYVVACHVLEHISIEERWQFLDQLLSRSKNGVVLINPFDLDGTHADERLKLFIEITDAQWAKEHLSCTLPKITDVKDYAAHRGLECHIKPCGSLTTGMAFVFLDFFANKAGEHENWKKVTSFFNERFSDYNPTGITSAHIVYLSRPGER